MAKAAKVAISLDTDLLQQVERVRERTGESRSAVVSRALRQLTRQEERNRRVREYEKAYREMPETPAEISAARTSARRSLDALRRRCTSRARGGARRALPRASCEHRRRDR